VSHYVLVDGPGHDRRGHICGATPLPHAPKSFDIFLRSRVDAGTRHRTWRPVEVSKRSSTARFTCTNTVSNMTFSPPCGSSRSTRVSDAAVGRRNFNRDAGAVVIDNL